AWRTWTLSDGRAMESGDRACILVSKKRSATLAPLASTFLTFLIHQLGERARNMSKSLTHGLQADAGIGISQPVPPFVRTFERDGKPLVLLQRIRQRPQGAKHAVFVDDIDLFVHG